MLNILRPGDRLALRLRLARAALLWERIWPAFWPALCVLGVFAAVALFDLLPGLPGLAHAALLALFAARIRCGGGLGRARGAARRLARHIRGAPPHRAGERAAAPSASGARRSPERAAGRRCAAAVGGAPAAHGGGAAPAARRLAGCRLGAARPVGHPLGSGDPAAAGRDRCRRRLARSRIAGRFDRASPVPRRRWPAASSCG